MPITDSIADMLTIIRNGSRAKKEKVDVKNSRMSREVLNILKQEGYINNFKVIEDKKQGVIRVYLKYDEENKSPAITQIKRVSKPGLRAYVKKEDIPRVLRGLGTAVISTHKGIVSDRKARKEKIGGEVICYVW
jgi:small subunit ribosomal protein S8